MTPLRDTVGPVREFGLTGGIGSGKSTVSSMLESRGALLIDADAIVRQLQQPGEPVFDAMVGWWGDRIVAPDGTLNRAAVAEIVFSDDDELARLNGLVHPAVAVETQRRIDEAPDDAIVVHDIPLLVLPGGELLTSRDHEQWLGIIVVDTPIETAVDRVVAARGMDRADVQARIDAQATRDERRAVADFVLDNSGSLAELEQAVADCWDWMTSIESGIESGREGDVS